ncbi:MAG: hypothetical protein ACOH2H_10275 [Cypionkella sp.]
MMILPALLVIAVVLTLLALVIVYGRPMLGPIRTRRETARILALDPETLADLQMEIALAGELAPTAYILLPTGEPAGSDEAIVVLPPVMRQERLSGRALRLKVEPGTPPKLSVELCKASPAFTQLGGKEFDLVGIPRIRTATGQEINRPLPEQWMRRNPRLMDLALDICPQAPARVLDVLLQYGTINMPFKWLGVPEPHTCKHCKTRRRPVMQLWGQALGLGAAAQVYVLACNCALDQFSAVVQIVGQSIG